MFEMNKKMNKYANEWLNIESDSALRDFDALKRVYIEVDILRC